MVAYYLTINKQSLRDMFKKMIYDEKVSGQEFELLEVRAFSETVRKLVSLEEKQI